MNEYKILGCLEAQGLIGISKMRQIYYDNTVYCDICGEYQTYDEYKEYKMCKQCINDNKEK